MKGLFLKDCYMIKKYCRAVLFLMIVFLAVSAVGEDNLFFTIYPMMVASIIPTTLLSYDEKSGWNVYSGTLPCSRAQLVSVKYLMAAVLIAGLWIISTVIQCIRAAAGVGVAWEELAWILSILLMLGLFSSGIIMPIMFKYGVEKGRIAYYITIAIVCGGGVAFPQIVENIHFSVAVQGYLIPVLFAAAGLALFGISWIVSIKIYEKREI
ncbi:MAG: ABC-2 transporter permease [Lachnospiraceae bacterium]